MNKKSDWLIPAGLVFLTIVPLLGGLVRIIDLGNNKITPENARFFIAPNIVMIHIIASLVYSFLGSLQFSNGFRKKYNQWHRNAGKLLIALGLISALTGLWMTEFFPHVETDGPTLYYVRMIVGVSMFLSIAFAVNAIRMKKFRSHGEWMIRAYALGLGAGTQVFTHLPWLAMGIFPTGLHRDAAMASGWIINILVAEWIIRRKHFQ